jgi:farnesyl-diphosphate farnesyltransferase
MEMDLTRFVAGTPEHPQSLATIEELDLYTYYVAGCVGEFWTAITCAYLPSLAHWQVGQMSEAGIRYGKGLQLTNIVKDVAKDLRLGRCYIPEVLLAPAGLTPESLLKPEAWPAFQPVLERLVRQAMDYLDQGWNYTMAIPLSEVRLRLACMWPILFGGETLALVQCSPNILDPGNTVRITRGCVYRIMALTALTGASGYVGTAYWRSLQRQAA